jgi:hypothetical protein
MHSYCDLDDGCGSVMLKSDTLLISSVLTEVVHIIANASGSSMPFSLYIPRTLKHVLLMYLDVVLSTNIEAACKRVLVELQLCDCVCYSDILHRKVH